MSDVKFVQDLLIQRIFILWVEVICRPTNHHKLMKINRVFKIKPHNCTREKKKKLSSMRRRKKCNFYSSREQLAAPIKEKSLSS